MRDLSESDYCGLCGGPKEGEDEHGSYCEPCLSGETEAPEPMNYMTLKELHSKPKRRL